MAFFFVLICPLPYAARKKLIHFLALNPVVLQILYGVKISFIFVGVLFIDAVSRLLKAQEEHRLRKAGKLAPELSFGTQPGGELIKLFYTQRNFYITGFTLFLSIVLARTFNIVQENVILEGEKRAYVAKHGPLTPATTSGSAPPPPPPPTSKPEDKKAL